MIVSEPAVPLVGARSSVRLWKLVTTPVLSYVVIVPVPLSVVCPGFVSLTISSLSSVTHVAS